MKYSELRQGILDVCKRLHAQGWLAACDGNISVRPTLPDGSPADEILITPTSRPKAFIRAEEIAILGLDGSPREGRASSESKMHLEVYQNAPLARAVVHAHPPASIAWTIARPELTELPSRSCSELILALGSVPFVAYARPGTEEMGKNLRAYLPKARALVLRNHGTITWGETLDEAYFGTERLEHSARLLKYATEISGGGKLPELPEAEVRELVKLRAQLGDKIL